MFDNVEIIKVKEIDAQEFWPKIKAIFDASKKRYIAICEARDTWVYGKLLLQLRAMRETQSPICLTAYQKCQYDLDGKLHEIFIRTPVKDFLYGCANVMPSMWLLDRKQIKSLPIPIQTPTRFPMDIAICMTLCQWVDQIPVINFPLMNYHAYPDRYSADPQDLITLRHYTQDMLSPRFKYIYPEFPWCLHPTAEEQQESKKQ